MALHKDPTDPTKLRPISMGSALRRITGKYVMEQYGPAFAEHFLSHGQNLGSPSKAASNSW